MLKETKRTGGESRSPQEGRPAQSLVDKQRFFFHNFQFATEVVYWLCIMQQTNEESRDCCYRMHTEQVFVGVLLSHSMNSRLIARRGES
jgi:hypothetical protein